VAGDGKIRVSSAGHMVDTEMGHSVDIDATHMVDIHVDGDVPGVDSHLVDNNTSHPVDKTTTCSKLVINEVLAYAIHAYSRSSHDSMRRTMKMFYTEQEIRDATSCLWMHHGDDFLGTRRLHRGSQNRSVVDFELDDLFKAISKLDQNPERWSNITFCAVNISRVPIFKPEEMELMSMVERLSILEQQVRIHTTEIGDIKGDISAVAHTHRPVSPVEVSMNDQTTDTATKSMCQKPSYANVMKFDSSKSSVTHGVKASAKRNARKRPLDDISGNESTHKKSKSMFNLPTMRIIEQNVTNNMMSTAVDQIMVVDTTPKLDGNNDRDKWNVVNKKVRKAKRVIGNNAAIDTAVKGVAKTVILAVTNISRESSDTDNH